LGPGRGTAGEGEEEREKLENAAPSIEKKETFSSVVIYLFPLALGKVGF